MSDDETMILLMSATAGMVGAFMTRISSRPRVYTENNPGIGLLRLSVMASVLWAAYVIQFHGDPSIEGVYVLFYLVMAYGVTKLFGQLATSLFGLKLCVDVYERRNLSSALFIAGFTLATGIVFGGSLWGEADPLSDAEGGWWIPFGFFLMGWGILVAATALYLLGEPGRFSRQITQERDTAMAWSAAVFMLSTATLILEGVSGDFWGWRHGILGMGTIAAMLIGHEIISIAGRSMVSENVLRIIERFVYVGLAVAAWVVNRTIDQAFMGGG